MESLMAKSKKNTQESNANTSVNPIKQVLDLQIVKALILGAQISEHQKAISRLKAELEPINMMFASKVKHGETYLGSIGEVKNTEKNSYSFNEEALDDLKKLFGADLEKYVKEETSLSYTTELLDIWKDKEHKLYKSVQNCISNKPKANISYSLLTV